MDASFVTGMLNEGTQIALVECYVPGSVLRVLQMYLTLTIPLYGIMAETANCLWD